MKTCSYCGATYPDDTAECPVDHASLRAPPAAAPPGAAPAADGPGLAFDLMALAPEQRQQAWVTLARCGTLASADMVACQLRGAGIEAFIPDASLMLADGMPYTFGYVRVQVAPKDYDAAAAILSEESHPAR